MIRRIVSLCIVLAVLIVVPLFAASGGAEGEDRTGAVTSSTSAEEVIDGLEGAPGPYAR